MIFKDPSKFSDNQARLRASNLQDQINELEEALEELTGRYLQLQNEAKAPGTALQRVIIDPLVAEGKSNCSTSEEKYKFDILGSVLEYETETETETSLMNKQT